MPTARGMRIAIFRRRARGGGFLLIEVVLAMSILVLVTVGLYQVMRASLTAAEEIRRSKLRAEQVAGLVELMRRSIEFMPNEATLTSEVREGTNGYSQVLTLAHSPMAFAFGRSSVHYGPKSIIAIPQVGGLSSLAIEYGVDPETRNQPAAGEKPPVLVLLVDVRKVEWLFYDERSTSWVEKWEDSSQRPALIRLTLSLPGEEIAYSATFRVPKGGATVASVNNARILTQSDSAGDGGSSAELQPGTSNTRGGDASTTTPAIRITQ